MRSCCSACCSVLSSVASESPTTACSAEADGCAWARVFAGVEGTVAALFAEHVMEHMTRPLELADFLTDSYRVGGHVSVLALTSL